MGTTRRRHDLAACVTVLIFALGLGVAGAREDWPTLAPPFPIADGIVINVPQRALFVVLKGEMAARFPVGLGLRTWPTFIGPFTIDAKEVDPTWDVPVSIQDEMRRAGKPVLMRVPPGPTNPLGKYWLGLSVPGYGIHGTNAPASVGRFATHGCIRMRADDIADLFLRVEVGTAGVSIYEPILLRVSADAIWLEAHPDAYRLDTRDGFTFVLEELARHASAPAVDWETTRRVLKARDGLAHRIDVYSTQ